MSSACLPYQILYIKIAGCTQNALSSVIEFLTLENVQPQQIYKRITVVYGEDVLSYPLVTQWAAEFR